MERLVLDSFLCSPARWAGKGDVVTVVVQTRRSEEAECREDILKNGRMNGADARPCGGR